MTTMTHPPADTRCVIGGIDTHKDVHVAAALDEHGRLLDTGTFPTTATGYRQLLSWLRSHGEVVAVGIEGTGSWGAGVARHLSSQGVEVREVMRPNRQHRRRHGKSDEADAIGAARAVLAGEALGTPKSQTGTVEAIRLLRVARRSAMKARTQAGNQIHAIVDTAPEQLRRHFVGRPTTAIVAETALFRRRQRPDTPLEAAAPRPAHARSSLGIPRQRARRARRPTRRTHRPGRANAARDQRCRRPSRHRPARRGWRQPRPAQIIVVVRGTVRCLTDRRFVGPATTPPPQPLRRPPRQLGAARRHHQPPPMARPDPGLHGPPTRRRTHQEDGHALPQTTPHPRSPPRHHHRPRPRSSRRARTRRTRRLTSKEASGRGGCE